MKLLSLLGTVALAFSATPVAATNPSKFKVHISVHHKDTTTTTSADTKSTTTTTTTTTSSSSSSSSSDGSWHMKPVKSIQARVQGDAPIWDATNHRFVSSYGSDFESKYVASLDTVNLASVEGALMYVQAEGINVDEQSVKCKRKNQMQYVVFYQLTIVQPNASLAYYSQPDHGSPTREYCPFVPMDAGKCTPAGEDLPVTCKQFDGVDNQLELGHCVGAEAKDTDKRAPYPDTYWFSYPNACPTQVWQDKTSECRRQQHGGLCAPTVQQPDGVDCTFSYEILGYVNLDDVVGITSMTNAKTNAKYSNYTEFCNDGGVEFSATNAGGEFNPVKSALPFWQNPGDPQANAKRAQTMVQVYNDNVAKGTGAAAKNPIHFKPLPSVDQLTQENPKCYENDKQCAMAPNGCKRTLYAQLCEICETAGDAGCVKAPSDFKFVELRVPAPKQPSAATGSNSGSALAGATTSLRDAKTTQDTSDATTRLAFSLPSTVALVLAAVSWSLQW